MVTRKRLYSERGKFLTLSGVHYKYNQYQTTLGGLSSVCAKLEPTISKNKEILEINVLQKFTPHALCFASVYVTTPPLFESNLDHKLSPFFVMQIQDIVMIKLYER